MTGRMPVATKSSFFSRLLLRTSIAERNIQVLSGICPTCFEQFDMGQIALARKTKEKLNIPSFFFTQLIGLALGLNPKELGLDVHRVKAKKLLENIGVS
jgi:heterodisulfide reductase subunit B2